MDFFEKREKIFASSVTETLIIILFLAILLSSMKQRRIENYADILGVETTEIEEQIKQNQDTVSAIEDIISSGETLSDFVDNKKALDEQKDLNSYYNYQNTILSGFLDSLAEGYDMNKISNDLVKENAQLMKELEQFEGLASTNEELMKKNEELKKAREELEKAEEDIKAYKTLMANYMKSGNSEGDMDHNEEKEQEKELNKAKEKAKKLEDNLKKLNEEKQDLQKKLAGMQQDFSDTKDVLADKESDLQQLNAQLEGINAPACGTVISHGFNGSSNYIFQIDFTSQCPQKLDKWGKPTGELSCDDPTKNKYYLRLIPLQEHLNNTWLISKSPQIAEIITFPGYELKYSEDKVKTGGQGTLTNFGGLGPVMKRLDGLKKSRYKNINDPYCQDWRNQVKGRCRECTYFAYYGKVDKNLSAYLPQIHDILGNYLSIKQGWINEPDKWLIQ